MKNFVLAPDSFKGTISAQDVCAIEAEVIKKYIPDAVVHTIPMADGGEGMVESYLKIMGGERVTATVRGPLGDPVEAVYGLLPDGSAVIEMAAAAGLPLVQGREDPLHTSTWGVGQLIEHARESGVKKILLGLGGSSTNDCGIGMAAALGFKFFDESGEETEPLACNLGSIVKITPPEGGLGVEIKAACDVDNPLLGERGATYTFGPQKGADASMLKVLEAGMTSFASVVEAYSGMTDGTKSPGAGAAGGMGTAVLLLLGGELLPGAELLLDSAGFNEMLKEADLVITGEGRMDWQSAFGKVPGAVAKRCKEAGVKCLALCGSLGKNAESLYEYGITAMFSAVNGAATFEEIQKTCNDDLRLLTDSVIRVMM